MGSILKIGHNGHEESVINLVVGAQAIRKTKIIPLYDFISADSAKKINALIQTIHFCREDLGAGFSDTVYYRNSYGHAIACLNDSIINLVSGPTDLYVTRCGGILFYGEHDLYSTIDMQSLDFHDELDEIFREYRIIEIFQSSGYSCCDYITLQNMQTTKRCCLELISSIDLSGDGCAVRISFKDALI